MSQSVYYCWVKITSTPPSPPNALANLNITPYHDPRYFPNDQTGILHDPRSTILSYGNGELINWWSIDQDYNGIKNSTYSIQINPVYGDRSAAIDWLKTPKGIYWLKDAINYELITFNTEPQKPEIQLQSARSTATPPTLPSDLPKFPCQFPVNAWSDKFLNLTTPLNNFLPVDCLKGLKLPKLPTQEKDCSDVVDYSKERDAKRDTIIRQAQSSLDAVWDVLILLGNDPYLPHRPATIELVGALLDTLQAPLFQLKTACNRGRPYHCCDGQHLDEMFINSSLYPGHPSYPSGHATNVHALALVLGKIKPKLSSDFKKAAEEIALNRVRAGVHFPSDSDAGAALAEHLVKQLLKPGGDFAHLVAAAKAEW